LIARCYLPDNGINRSRGAFGYPGMPLWEELATLVTIMLFGHWLEMRSIAQAEGALAQLTKLLPNTAARWTSSQMRTGG